MATQGGVDCPVKRPWYTKWPPLSVLFSMFLHAGWLHQLGNMLFLAVFGNNIEDRLGKLPVAYLAHVVGFVFGALVGLVIRAAGGAPAGGPPGGGPARRGAR